MDRELLRQALTKFFAGLVLTALLVFVPAGTLRYPGGLLLRAVLFGPMFIAGLVMMKRAPDLLRRRLNAKEEQLVQKGVIALSGLMFVACFVLGGLSFRLSWLTLPWGVQLGAAAVFLVGYALFGEVLRENEYLSRTVEVQEGQKLVDTGLYGLVRHPMYFATVLMFWAMPLVLGSLASFAVMLPYPFLLVRRIQNEEQVLEEGLEGYAAYKQKVRWRLIPYVW